LANQVLLSLTFKVNSVTRKNRGLAKNARFLHAVENKKGFARPLRPSRYLGKSFLPNSLVEKTIFNVVIGD